MQIVIGYLYPDLMNIYGDTGNIIALSKRCLWRGIKVEVKNISAGDKLEKGQIDLFFFGGGQDQQQEIVSRDLNKGEGGRGKGEVIREEVKKGIPLLSICGGYQLLGEYYAPFNGPRLAGVGLFPAYTLASHDRMIGNIAVRVQAFGSEAQARRVTVDSKNPAPYLVGFENHSGKTYLKKDTQPLGKVIKGFGNNGEDRTEGCIYKNAIGTYMHGPLLPKNPHLADWLIKKALEVKYKKKIELEPLDNTLEDLAHQKAVKRFS